MAPHDPIAQGDLTYAADPGCREQNRTWTFYELAYVRREAQSEAELAYEGWSQLPGADGYAVYRAAQDRADAAQDQLATWVRRTQPVLPSSRRAIQVPGVSASTSDR